MDTFNTSKYEYGYFLGGSNNNFNLITREDEFHTVNTPKLCIELVSYVYP